MLRFLALSFGLVSLVPLAFALLLLLKLLWPLARPVFVPAAAHLVPQRRGWGTTSPCLLVEEAGCWQYVPEETAYTLSCKICHGHGTRMQPDTRLDTPVRVEPSWSVVAHSIHMDS